MKQFITLLLCAYSLSVSADTIRGIVFNGTSRKASAGDEVILKRIGNGMEDAGKTKTNLKGGFSFTVADGQQQRPFVVWVKHQEITYSQMVIAGKRPAEVQVFDGSTSVANIRLAEHVMVLQTLSAGDQLKIDELYTLDNQSSPPLTRKGQRTFDIILPDDARLQDASAQTTGSIPLKVPVVADKADKNKYYFSYPVRPGQTQFHLTYTIPYGGKLTIMPKFSMPAAQMLIAMPNTIHFSAEDASSYAPAGNPQMNGVSIYLANNKVGSQRNFGFQIEGSGAMPREQAGGATTAQAQSETSLPGGGLGVPNEQPDPLHNSQWMFLCMMTLFLVAGGVFVYSSKRPLKMKASPQSGGTNSNSILLEAMKEEIFQLESDRLQQKISPREYDDQKAALDKTLQRAVQRQET